MRYNLGSNGDGGGFMIGGSNIRCHFPEVWLKYILAFTHFSSVGSLIKEEIEHKNILINFLLYKFKFTELNQKSSKELFFLFYNSIIMV